MNTTRTTHRKSGLFGALLRRYRLAASLTQEALGERAQISLNTVAALEHGRRAAPRPTTVVLLADALGLGPAERAALIAAATEARRTTGPWPNDFAVRPGHAIHNLPAEPSSFVGREQDLRQVRDLLLTTRLLSLVGAGGVGKTRLALRVAAEVVDEYPHGVWLVDLAPVADGALVPNAVASALTIQEQPALGLAQTLADVLRTRALLLIVDNCEAVVDACAELVDQLLRACPQIRILATSRESLRVAGETTWRVPSLSVPAEASRVTVEELVDHDATRLFIARARAVVPGLRIMEVDALAIADVCRRLDGIPLAIELAASRVKVLMPEQIAERLDDRFRLLTGGSRTALPRQQTLRALVDWSYDLLNPPEQALLHRLSVFAGGWTLASAEAICAHAQIAAWEVLDLLGALVEKSLVLAEEQDDGTLRYRLLETLRQYADEKLGEDDRAAVEETHSRYFLEKTEDGFHRYWGPGSGAWCDWLEREHDNLRAVLARRHVLAGRNATADEQALRAARTASCLTWFWAVRSYWHEGRIWLGSFSRLRHLPPDVESGLLAWHSCLAFFQGDFVAADGLARRALDIEEQTGLQAGAAISGGLRAIYAIGAGRLEEAGERAAGCLAMMRAVAQVEFEAVHLPPRPWMTGIQHHVLAQRALFAGALDEAVEASGIALETMRGLGEPFGLTMALSLRGLLATRTQDLTRARAFLQEALTLAQDGAPRSVADILGRLATVMHASGDVAEARRLYAQSLDLGRELGHKFGVSEDLLGLAAMEMPVDPGAGTTLLAASQALLTAIAARLRPVEQQEFTQYEQVARTALTDQEFTSAWNAGAAMSYDDAVRFAIERASVQADS